MTHRTQWTTLALIASMIAALFVQGLAEAAKQEIETFDELKAAVRELWKGQHVEEAILLLRTGLQLFPDRSFEITSSLINMNLGTDRVEHCFDLFEYGHERGHYYPIYTKSGPLTPYLENHRFQAIVQRNRTLIAEAEKHTERQLRVNVPEDKGADHSLPLIIVLHGWSGNIGGVDRVWWPEGERGPFIVAYLQSSQIVGKNMFGWDDVSRARQDVREAYDELTSAYPVDPTSVVIAGFSQGGGVAIDVAINNVVPVAGFVAHCPGGGLTEGVSLDAVQSAASRGLRGTILTGQIDHSRDEQELLVGLFDQASLVHRYVTIPNLGHWYPDDFAERLDAAVAHILSREGATKRTDGERVSGRSGTIESASRSTSWLVVAESRSEGTGPE